MRDQSRAPRLVPARAFQPPRLPVNPSRFTDFFRAATATKSTPAGNAPYDYQCRLACGERDAGCKSRLIDILTGLGKATASLV